MQLIQFNPLQCPDEEFVSTYVPNAVPGENLSFAEFIAFSDAMTTLTDLVGQGKIMFTDPLQLTSNCDAFNFYFNLPMTIVAGTIVVFIAIRLANRS